VPERAVFAGEVGLGGEIRPIGLSERRLGEAARLGFGSAFVPEGTRAAGGIIVRACADLQQVIEEALS
jgi:DNA repair protein RadA/Sms